MEGEGGLDTGDGTKIGELKKGKKKIERELEEMEGKEEVRKTRKSERGEKSGGEWKRGGSTKTGWCAQRGGDEKK